MTTAHRPTWAPAKGGEEQGGNRIFVPSKQRSAKDAPSHTQLKFRVEGQASSADVAKKDLRMELEVKERRHFAKKQGINFEEERQKDLLMLQDSGGGKGTKALIPKAIDADEEDEEGQASSSSSDDDDDEDDEEELLAELERIKRERAEEAAKKAAEDAAKAAKEKEKELITGNPLLAIGAEPTFSIKRRWDDDVVFKNQARGEPKQQKRFINDTIRSDFHRRFLNRYVR